MKTVYRPGEAQFVEKKSKFLGFLIEAADQDQVQEFLAELRKKYWDASHHVSAFRLGPTGALERASDDGEPSGTAGMPILDVMRGAELTNAAVVVVRYFGGTLLGAGGLVRAYSQAAKDAIAAATLIEKHPYLRFACTLSYNLWGKVQYHAQQNNIPILEPSYADNITCTFLIEEHAEAAFLEKMADLTGAQAQLTPAGKVEAAWVSSELIIF